MRILVDGYNVTKGDPATAGRSLDEQREALVARLAARGRELVGRGAIVVIFDGVAGGGQATGRGPVEVRFSREEEADELIVRLAAEGDATVVTSDATLARRAAAAGARILGAETCFEAGRGKRRGRYPAGGVGLPPGANKVTEELKKLWLDDGE